MTNIFSNLSLDGLEQQGDILGGGSSIFESGVYDGTVKLAFAGQKDSGSRFVEIHVQIGDKTYRETFWVIGKNGQHYYERDGKKIPLPGFTQANDVCLLTTGKSLSEQPMEEKVVKLYNFDEKKELPTKVNALVDVIGKPITLAILKQTVNRTRKDASGNYVGYIDDTTGKTAVRDENTIDKVFHAETGKTVSEFLAKQEKAEFKEKWADKNTGVTRNRVKPVEGNTGMPGQSASGGGSKPSSGLFG